MTGKTIHNRFSSHGGIPDEVACIIDIGEGVETVVPLYHLQQVRHG